MFIVLFTVLPEQLGLKREATTAAVTVLAIEAVGVSTLD